MQPTTARTSLILSVLDAANALAPMGKGKRAVKFADFPRMHGATVYNGGPSGEWATVHLHGLPFHVAAVLPRAEHALADGATYNRHHWRDALRAGLAMPAPMDTDPAIAAHARSLPFDRSTWTNTAGGNADLDAPSSLWDALASTAPAVAVESTRYAISGLQVRTYGMGHHRHTVCVGTDGRRIHAASPTMPGAELAEWFNDCSRVNKWTHGAVCVLPREAVETMLRFRKRATSFVLEWTSDKWHASIGTALGTVELWGDAQSGKFPAHFELRKDGPERWKIYKAGAVAKRVRAIAKCSPEYEAVDVTDGGTAGLYIRPQRLDNVAAFVELASEEAAALEPGNTDWRTFHGPYLADALECCGERLSLIPGHRELHSEQSPHLGYNDAWPLLVVGDNATAMVMPISRC